MIDSLLKHTKISGTGNITCRKTLTENEKGMKHEIAHDLFEQLKKEHNLDNRGWLTHGWQKEKQWGLSMRPYHKEERNLLLACSLFPGSERKQFFQVKKRKAAVWKQKNNKAYFNYTLVKPVTSRKENASRSMNQEIKGWFDTTLAFVLQASE